MTRNSRRREGLQLDSTPRQCSVASLLAIFGSGLRCVGRSDRIRFGARPDGDYREAVLVDRCIVLDFSAADDPGRSRDPNQFSHRDPPALPSLHVTFPEEFNAGRISALGEPTKKYHQSGSNCCGGGRSGINYSLVNAPLTGF
jgi:hypothetical protein